MNLTHTLTQVFLFSFYFFSTLSVHRAFDLFDVRMKLIITCNSSNCFTDDKKKTKTKTQLEHCKYYVFVCVLDESWVVPEIGNDSALHESVVLLMDLDLYSPAEFWIMYWLCFLYKNKG